MAQAFGQKQNAFEKKIVGIATIITGETKARLTLVEEGKQFKNGQKTIDLPLEDLPDIPVLPKKDKSAKQYRIRMNAEGDEVEAITPVTGVFDLKLIDLGKRPEKDSEPMPYEKVWNEGKSNENRYLEFFAVYKITSGFYKGCQVPAYQLHYKFEEDPDNPGFARFTFSLQNKQATRGKQLAEWGHYQGIWEVQGTEVVGEPIEWDDETILPELLQRALDADRNVRGVFKNGYIQELLPADETPGFVEAEDDGELDEVDAAFPKEKVKAPAKSPKATGVKGRNTPKPVKASSTEDDEL
jgi:hypothetical protein